MSVQCGQTWRRDLGNKYAPSITARLVKFSLAMSSNPRRCRVFSELMMRYIWFIRVLGGGKWEWERRQPSVANDLSKKKSLLVRISRKFCANSRCLGCPRVAGKCDDKAATLVVGARGFVSRDKFVRVFGKTKPDVPRGPVPPRINPRTGRCARRCRARRPPSRARDLFLKKREGERQKRIWKVRDARWPRVPVSCRCFSVRQEADEVITEVTTDQAKRPVT